MNHLLIGANSTGRYQGINAEPPKSSIRTITYELVGKSSIFSVVLPNSSDEKVFAARIDKIEINMAFNGQDPFLMNLDKPNNPELWDLSPKNAVSLTASPVREVFENKLKNDWDLIAYEMPQLAGPSLDAYKLIQDVDSDSLDTKVFKFKDPTRVNRTTYVGNKDVHQYVTVKCPDLEGRVTWQSDSSGVVCTASRNPTNPNIFDFVNTSQDIARLKRYSHTLDFELLHESVICNYYPDGYRPERPMYISGGYKVILTLYLKSTG